MVCQDVSMHAHEAPCTYNEKLYGFISSYNLSEHTSQMAAWLSGAKHCIILEGVSEQSEHTPCIVYNDTVPTIPLIFSIPHLLFIKLALPRGIAILLLMLGAHEHVGYVYAVYSAWTSEVFCLIHLGENARKYYIVHLIRVHVIVVLSPLNIINMYCSVWNRLVSCMPQHIPPVK